MFSCFHRNSKKQKQNKSHKKDKKSVSHSPSDQLNSKEVAFNHMFEVEQALSIFKERNSIFSSVLNGTAEEADLAALLDKKDFQKASESICESLNGFLNEDKQRNLYSNQLTELINKMDRCTFKTLNKINTLSESYVIFYTLTQRLNNIPNPSQEQINELTKIFEQFNLKLKESLALYDVLISFTNSDNDDRLFRLVEDFIRSTNPDKQNGNKLNPVQGVALLKFTESYKAISHLVCDSIALVNFIRDNNAIGKTIKSLEDKLKDDNKAISPRERNAFMPAPASNESQIAQAQPYRPTYNYN